MRISFLIAAHNEEKIIGKMLDSLVKLPYKDYEVIVGLDGCTDRTEEIVKEICKESNKIKYYSLNLRKGKPAVINFIIKKAKGEIIVIQDADWILKVKDKESFSKFISVFDNNEIGGIAESFPVEWQEDKLKRGNLGFRMIAYSSYFWLEYQKKRFTYKKNKSDDFRFLKESTMFLTNIFRKKLYKENFSLGDDFERTQEIMKRKYKMVLFEDINMPRMTSVYDKVNIKDLYKQKVRTAIARQQLTEEQNADFSGYYLPVIWHINKRSWSKGIGVGFIVLLWTLISVYATIVSKFKKIGTREGWKLRARD